MVRLKGPLQGDSASGSLAGQLTFSTWQGRAYARRLVQPNNPQSPAQTSNRSMLTLLGNLWKLADFGIMNEWKVIADPQRITPFNSYLRENLLRWQSFLGCILSPTTIMDQSPQAPPFTAVGSIRRVTLSIESTSTGSAPVCIIFRSASPTAPATKHSMVGTAITYDQAYTWIDEDLPPGTYYYRTAGMDTTGFMSVASDPSAATVT